MDIDTDDIDDVEELKEVMQTLNDTVPSLISGIVEAIYNTEDSEKLAKSTANFYKELVDAGMDEDKAYELTRDFMQSRDITSVIKEVLSDAGSFKGENFDEDIGEEIKQKVERKMEEKEE
ncbi:MAG: hypothetical protein KGY76_09440 [Candidatus Thermoplasmatota archaeon]|nr:hypothetical protein [Candidatus Thermoplasmatota archaeon]